MSPEVTDQLLIIFAKVPEKGKVKTRLARTLGEDRALQIYYQLLERTATVTQVLPQQKIVYYSPEIQYNDIWDENHFLKAQQSDGDLGQRMEKAFREGFDGGFRKICIIGSDCYQLSSNIIKQAFRSLDDHDIVTGPAADGGYYLLGMKEIHPLLFKGKRWSTPSVLKDTIADIKKRKLSCFLLPELTDVDTEDDLHSMRD
jgi:hypothetical protein